MDLHEYLRLLRTRWRLIASMTVLATPHYEAQAKFDVSARTDMTPTVIPTVKITPRRVAGL